MAKNDKKKMQQTVNTQTGEAQNNLNRVNSTVMGAQQDFKNNYDTAVPMQMQDYRDLMDMYKSYTGSLPANNLVNAERVSYNRTPEMQKAMSGYSEFADTGGFSEENKTDLRSRALSPVSTVYNNMKNEMARQRNVQGGYSPNFNAASAKMRSGASQQMSDIAQQVNASIAEAVQKGRLAGIGGLGDLATTDTGFGQQAQLANQQASLTAGLANQRNSMYDPRLQALNAASSLFGTRPGMAALFGDQMLGAQDQLLQGQGYQNQIGNQAIYGQNLVSQTPSNFETGLNRVGQIGSAIGNVGAGIMGLPGMGGGNTGVAGPVQQAYQTPTYNPSYNPSGQISYPNQRRVSFG